MRTISQILESQDYSKTSKRSLRWFTEQAQLLQKEGLTSREFLNKQNNHDRKGIMLGHMYLFRYYPKGVGKLPVWDMYPLVIPFRIVENGFLGINFHYLGYRQRMALINHMMKYSNGRTTSNASITINENTRLRLGWDDLVKDVRIGMIARQSVHRYLIGRVVSDFRKIDPRNWETALELPFERFIYD